MNTPTNDSTSKSRMPGKCPVDHAAMKRAEAAAKQADEQPSKCPVAHTPPAEASASGCPVDHDTRAAYLEQLKREEPLNPLNQMPELSQTPEADQSVDLSTERTVSSIPKNEARERWEYPSPQQFYHALRRKGKEAPEEHVDVMVDIHNFLNEACWDEVLKWEQLHESERCQPLLVRFLGRPYSLSPKARFFGWFGTPPPFDRHDWTIDRCGREVRYVLDYYSAEPDEHGMPVFSVDVRPALDSFGSAWDRMRMGVREMRERWWPSSAADTTTTTTATTATATATTTTPDASSASAVQGTERAERV